ncbi:MAG: sigma factor-like helix-turn-helix DNA-binding protein [Acidimicrobiia bacterium]|nr:sigma factor-like helix-turn-helix DNA-binding protein [Acidimicrobiia bacterium]
MSDDEILADVLGVLTPEERSIVKMLYVAEADLGLTRSDIAKLLDVSRSSLYRLEQRAMQKMKTRARRAGLRPAP